MTFRTLIALAMLTLTLAPAYADFPVSKPQPNTQLKIVAKKDSQGNASHIVLFTIKGIPYGLSVYLGQAFVERTRLTDFATTSTNIRFKTTSEIEKVEIDGKAFALIRSDNGLHLFDPETMKITRSVKIADVQDYNEIPIIQVEGTPYAIVTTWKFDEREDIADPTYWVNLREMKAVPLRQKGLETIKAAALLNIAGQPHLISWSKGYVHRTNLLTGKSESTSQKIESDEISRRLASSSTLETAWIHGVPYAIVTFSGSFELDKKLYRINLKTMQMETFELQVQTVEGYSKIVQIGEKPFLIQSSPFEGLMAQIDLETLQIVSTMPIRFPARSKPTITVENGQTIAMFEAGNIYRWNLTNQTYEGLYFEYKDANDWENLQPFSLFNDKSGRTLALTKGNHGNVYLIQVK